MRIPIVQKKKWMHSRTRDTSTNKPTLRLSGNEVQCKLSDGESQYPAEISSNRMGWGGRAASAEPARVRKELDGQRTRTDAVVDRSYVENGDFLSQFGAQIQARLNLSEQVDGLTQT